MYGTLRYNRFTLWTPALITKVAWYDAADPTTIIGSPGVSQWNDKSGNGYDAVQGTGSAQPQTGTRTLNGINVLDFDGGDTLISTFTTSGSRSVYVLFCYDSAAGGMFCMDNRASFSAATFYALSTIYKNYNGGSAVNEIGAISIDTNPHFRDFIISGTSGTNYHDGALDVAGTVGTNGMNGLSIGARYALGTKLNGYIAEIILCASAHDTETRQKIEGYLAWKWKLQANLPVGHPYKMGPPRAA